MSNINLLDNEFEITSAFRTGKMGRIELFITGLSLFYIGSYFYNLIRYGFSPPLWEVIYLMVMMLLPAIYMVYFRIKSMQYDALPKGKLLPVFLWICRYILPVIGSYLILVRIMHFVFYFPEATSTFRIWLDFIGFSVLDIVWSIGCWMYFREINRRAKNINYPSKSSRK
jgi:hypothetical protein